jgi:hypothetical protein
MFNRHRRARNPVTNISACRRGGLANPFFNRIKIEAAPPFAVFEGWDPTEYGATRCSTVTDVLVIL